MQPAPTVPRHETGQHDEQYAGKIRRAAHHVAESFETLFRVPHTPRSQCTGGASVLVDSLLDAGFKRLAVLDISGAALTVARQRLEGHAGDIEWFEADVTGFNSPHQFILWHDRAVFHFLTDKADRQKYVQTLKRSLVPDGHVIITTFAMDGRVERQRVREGCGVGILAFCPRHNGTSERHGQ